MSLYQQSRAFWRTDSWCREQSATWAARHYSGEICHVAARVMFCLMDSLGEDPEHLSPASAFFTDIDLDDFNDVLLVEAVEEEFKISIPDQDAEAFLSLGQLIEYINKQLEHDIS
jgi:acyl carrier protein